MGSMSPKQSRYRLLLDEMFPRRAAFPRLNNFHDLRHVIHDFRLIDNRDENVVGLAKNQKRILISKNEKHMIELCGKESVILICVTEAMTNEEVDKQITSVLRKLGSDDRIVKLSRPSRKGKK